MKKLLLILVVLNLMFHTMFTDINAASYPVTLKYDTSWTLKGDMYGPGAILYVDGSIAFCLDSLKAASTGSNSTVTASSLGLSDKDMQTLSLIAWYGYRSKSNPTNTDYFLTQNLIWEYLGTPGNYAANSTYSTKAKMRSTLDGIMSKVNNYFVKPSFNGNTYTVDAGSTLTLTDTNKVLSALSYSSVTGATISKSSNTLKITPDGTTSKVVIKFNRGLSSTQKETNFIVRNGNSQPISCLYTGSDPYSASVTINVNQFGNLQLSKKDPDGNYIKDVSFKLSYYSDMSNPIGTYTTNDNGIIVLNNLKAGTVYIQETKVPSYLKLDSTIYSKTITPNTTNYYNAVNEYNRINLQLAKKDPEGNLVANTTFLLSYNSDMSNPIGSYTTKEDGKIIVENLLIKDVYIQEIDVPDYLELDSTIYCKSLVDISTKINYFTLKNDYNYINLQLAKKDPDGNLIPNTTFRLSYNADMSDPIGDFTTKEDGKIIVEDVIVKDVYIQEIAVPDHLELDSTIYCKSLVDVYTKINYFTLTNDWSTSDLRIIKSDNAGHRVEGVRFAVSYNEDMSDLIGEYETDVNGEIFIENLRTGMVYIKETDVPDYLVLDDDIYSVEINKDEVSEFYMVNDIKTSSFSIYKKDSDGNPLKDISFKVSYNADMSNILGTYTTDKEGIIHIEDLNVGYVYIQEVECPSYIQLDSSIYRVKVEEDYINSIELVNEIKRGNLVIYKEDEEGYSLSDVSFEMSYNEDMSDVLGVYTTNDEGIIELNDLKATQVYIREVSVPSDIVMDDSIYCIRIEANSSVNFHLVNEYKKTDLVIKKIDNHYKTIKDTTFIISYDKDMNDIIGEYTTGKDGTVTISHLKVGKLYIQETDTPDHLYLDSTIHEIELKEDEVYKFTKMNKIKSISLTISKTVLGNTGELNKDFMFYIELDDLSINGVYGDVEFYAGRGEFTLRHNESVVIEDLPENVSYIIDEEYYDGYITYVNKSGEKETKSSSYEGILDENTLIEFKNMKGVIVETGIYTDFYRYVYILALSLCFVFVYIVKRVYEK